MDIQADNGRRAKVAAILSSQSDALTKARRLIALGYDEEEAEELVELSLIGRYQSIYYEQLPGATYADDEF
jgi:hypothetical protein